MKPVRILASVILFLMVGVLVWASTQQAIWSIPAEVIENPWFIATLADAYCGFIIFYVWLFQREENWNSRTGWLIALLFLGNVAAAIYLIREFTPLRRRSRRLIA